MLDDVVWLVSPRNEAIKVSLTYAVPAASGLQHSRNAGSSCPEKTSLPATCCATHYDEAGNKEILLGLEAVEDFGFTWPVCDIRNPLNGPRGLC